MDVGSTEQVGRIVASVLKDYGIFDAKSVRPPLPFRTRGFWSPWLYRASLHGAPADPDSGVESCVRREAWQRGGGSRTDRVALRRHACTHATAAFACAATRHLSAARLRPRTARARSALPAGADDPRGTKRPDRRPRDDRLPSR